VAKILDTSGTAPAPSLRSDDGCHLGECLRRKDEPRLVLPNLPPCGIRHCGQLADQAATICPGCEFEFARRGAGMTVVTETEELNHTELGWNGGPLLRVVDHAEAERRGEIAHELERGALLWCSHRAPVPSSRWLASSRRMSRRIPDRGIRT
jgi:hypothetical protein